MKTHQRLLPLAFLSLAVIAVIPSRASVSYTTSRFQITFPDGWQSLTVPGSADTLLAVFSQTTMAFSWMSVSITDHPMTADELDALRQVYAGSDSVVKGSDGTKTLGGKSFSYVEYEIVDTAEGNGRMRIYYTSSGNQLFTCLLSYEPGGTAAVTQMETALGTLSFVGTPIRALAARLTPSPRTGDHDVLGRARGLSTRTWLYSLPAH
jgi:hypothetical protein